jgi:cell division protein FtsB
MIRRKFDLIVTVVCLALLGYFGWHAFYGPRGFAHQEALEASAKDLKARLDLLQAEREKLDRRVSLMRPDSIDPDMLDELARANLDYGKPSDLVIMTSK